MFVGLIHARVRIPGAVTEAGLQRRVMKVMMLWTWKKEFLINFRCLKLVFSIPGSVWAFEVFALIEAPPILFADWELMFGK